MTHPTEVKLPESLEVTLRLLAASMRHSAGQWMVPGWDGHKVADVLQKAESALKARDAEIERLRGRAPKDLPTRIQVSYSPDDWDTFIYGVSGHLTIEALTAINASIHDDAEALFDKGPGEYVFGAAYFQGQYGFEGRCEIAPGWELEVEAFWPLDAAIDQARAEGGEKTK